jgi:3-hydroxybutyrate dehydrogenase
LDIREPEIKKEDILILDDSQFNAGNVCIVTGGGSGIGRATALAAAANKLTTLCVDINESEGRQTEAMAREMGGVALFHGADLTQDRDIEGLVEAAASLGNIKYLANIAGIQHIDAIEDFPMEKYDLMHRIMLRAPFYLSKLVIPHMKRQGDGMGVIGNMASVHAHICTERKPAYNITKFGLRALAQSISAEGAGKIRSFSLSTGFVRTALALNQIAAQSKQRRISPDEVVTNVMMGKSRIKKMMSPIDVANLFMFGFSRFAGYLVGGDLLFDGGMVLTY